MSTADAVATGAQVALELIKLAVSYVGAERAAELLSVEVANEQLRVAEAAMKTKLFARELNEHNTQLMVQELSELESAPDTEREP